MGEYFRSRATLRLYLCHAGRISVKKVSFKAKNLPFASRICPAGRMLPPPDIQSVPGIVALMKWKHTPGNTNTCWETQTNAGRWAWALNFGEFSGSNSIKKHQLIIGSIFLRTRVTIPGTLGRWTIVRFIPLQQQQQTNERIFTVICWLGRTRVMW